MNSDAINSGSETAFGLNRGKCRLCPRMCGVSRKGGTGFCQMPDRLRIARAALHYWEEPCISGNYGDLSQSSGTGRSDTLAQVPGSGAVFFSGCTLRCVFCQNYFISTKGQGREITVERLADIFLELEQQGAWNINLVTGGHYVPWIIRALDLAKSRGLSLPVVYNTSGYERVETLKMLDGYVDIYLPDFKYVSTVLSEKYSGAPDYFQVASAALDEMVRQVPECRFDGGTAVWRTQVAPERVAMPERAEVPEGARGLRMTRGVIVRHLLLPGCLLDSKRVVRYLYETYGDRIYLSLMNQYTPLPQVAERFPELNCRVRKKSYDKLIAFALDLGVSNAFIQEGETARESFIPEFDGEGV